MTAEPASRSTLEPVLAAHLDTLASDLDGIAEPHHSAGRRLAEWLAEHYRPGITLPVVVVCTGNSRRSVLGAMMGNAAAVFIELPEIRFWSAGTSPSAFNPRHHRRAAGHRVRDRAHRGRGPTRVRRAPQPVLPRPLGLRGETGTRRILEGPR